MIGIATSLAAAGLVLLFREAPATATAEVPAESEQAQADAVNQQERVTA